MEVRDLIRIFSNTSIVVTDFFSAVVQTFNKSEEFDGESSLDLQYGMGLTNPQPVTLLQVGDLVEGSFSLDDLTIAVNTTTQAAGSTIGLMQSMHRFALPTVEMIQHW
jgi:hypothetical protein